LERGCRKQNGPRRSARGGKLDLNGRGERIRTSDFLDPNQALYQAEPRPETISLACCNPIAQLASIIGVSELRELPSVHEVMTQLGTVTARFPHGLIVHEIRLALDDARRRIRAHEAVPEIVMTIENALEAWRRPSLQRVINATGVVLHTNLGRAPLGPVEICPGYSNLEYDLTTGLRGKRDSHTAPLLEKLLGKPCIAVNNGAAALFLVLHELAAGFEVIVSRGELIEIGDGFRIPEIMARSGAILREVGTTNRTHISDYRDAINERTRLILRVHPSNFHITGFTARPTIAELAALGKETGIPVHEDLGSGCLIDIGLDEPLVTTSLKAGINLVSFSGDKLLGGPQAGLIAGEAALVTRVRRNPMFRALRLDKMMVQALESTLRAFVLEEWNRLPALRMIRMTADEIRQRALALLPGAELVAGESVIGGGSTPDRAIKTWLISLPEIEKKLRRNHPPVISRVENGRTLLDLRTVFPDEEAELKLALDTCLPKY
jgi:L-seryl-tRNA(Ser) seleniumtransferase